MAEMRNMTKKIENFEWTSLLDLTGKGLSQYNAVEKKLDSISFFLYKWDNRKERNEKIYYQILLKL